jgi:nitronate monooxygenase
MLGGMGVNISVPELALVVANAGGIGHLSDAGAIAVSDLRYGTTFVRDRYQQNKGFADKLVKEGMEFDLAAVREATVRLVSDTMSKKKAGAIFLNVMEKLTMGNPRDTLHARLHSAMDAGIDGITLGAGLHMGSMELMRDHPRFQETLIGIIVSSARALKIFLNRAAKAGRMPDYIVVEGPLAGGHLGFDENWADYDLRTIMREVLQLLESQDLHIPVIAAGGIFTGTDGVEIMGQGAAGIQVATRFAITQESGLPDHVKQQFFIATEEDVVVNFISATGYPMRMLRGSPAIGSTTPPQCESYGYALDGNGKCSYLDAHAQGSTEKTCLCAQMRNYAIWTCGHTVSRLKETAFRLPDGTYEQPAAADIVEDYLTSEDGSIQVPAQRMELAASV